MSSGGQSTRGRIEHAIVARALVRAKALPRKVPPASSPARMVDAAADVVATLERFTRDSSKMRILAMASAVYGREPDAEWFLEKAREPEARSPRCSRCGHVHGKTRAHW